ncbi:MAG: thiosulfate oxidation carrier complex protein SoxZ [Betaproteobacteria bacterium]|nr:thiosulfate oxidation carrier complex protein SoxZ [Betaproteobacteria bacterium]
MAGAAPSADIVINAPDVPESSAFVPIQIESRVPGTQAIAVFVDRNPFPFIARFELTPPALPLVSLRLRVGETSPVRVIVEAGGRYHVAIKEVTVVGGGCTDPAFSGDPSGAPAKSGPTKIRATIRGSSVDLRALLAHPMENGLRRDPAGKLIAEHFIRELDVRLNGKTVITAQIGRSVSTNPLFAFKLQGGRVNDKLVISWRDNKGLARIDEAAVSA